ncbi:hypothetical protein GPJ56_001978 [Histomonas meleagridis]|uniref:uncharacterized protein n=1 Tax=Histomonas meleagridis TaxID=135588 RepID=UPI00355965A0|nr:hypothetical protein GPJ56_001978 [Histomonas meleagridis]KAH0800946.1 hypothetical protein GO595_006262 [Histomonas meleagridis]
MGCCNSKQEVYSVQEDFIDIPLLNKPKQRSVPADNSNSNYFSIEQYTNSTPYRRRSSYDGGIIEQTQLSLSAAPDIELSRQQKFTECFSHIDVSTFQNIPIMSAQSHLSVPNVGDQVYSSFDFDDYSRFLDQVLNKIATPLVEMKVVTDKNISISI